MEAASRWRLETSRDAVICGRRRANPGAMAEVSEALLAPLGRAPREERLEDLGTGWILGVRFVEKDVQLEWMVTVLVYYCSHDDGELDEHPQCRHGKQTPKGTLFTVRCGVRCGVGLKMPLCLLT